MLLALGRAMRKAIALLPIAVLFAPSLARGANGGWVKQGHLSSASSEMANGYANATKQVYFRKRLGGLSYDRMIVYDTSHEMPQHVPGKGLQTVFRKGRLVILIERSLGQKARVSVEHKVSFEPSNTGATTEPSAPGLEGVVPKWVYDGNQPASVKLEEGIDRFFGLPLPMEGGLLSPTTAEEIKKKKIGEAVGIPHYTSADTKVTPGRGVRRLLMLRKVGKDQVRPMILSQVEVVQGKDKEGKDKWVTVEDGWHEVTDENIKKYLGVDNMSAREFLEKQYEKVPDLSQASSSATSAALRQVPEDTLGSTLLSKLPPDEGWQQVAKVYATKDEPAQFRFLLQNAKRELFVFTHVNDSNAFPTREQVTRSYPVRGGEAAILVIERGRALPSLYMVEGNRFEELKTGRQVDAADANQVRAHGTAYRSGLYVVDSKPARGYLEMPNGKMYELEDTGGINLR